MSLKARRRHKRDNNASADLDITPFMNLMIVLVPVLLLSMVFTHTKIIDLDLPPGSENSMLFSEQLQLEVQLLDDAIVISDQRGVIKRITKLEDGAFDFRSLSLVMQEIKQRLPDKRDAIVLSQPETDYQTLVYTMDSMRSFSVTVAGEQLAVELFPDLSLGDVLAVEGVVADMNGDVTDDVTDDVTGDRAVDELKAEES